MTTAEFIIDNSGDEAAERKNARKVLLAFLAALLVHLVIGYCLAAWNGVFTPPVPVEEKPIELTFVDLATPAPTVPKNSAFIETDESKKAPEPKDKTFESNANSIGASEVAATGDMPLPSQNGKDRPFMDLETHQYSLGSQGAQAQPSAAPTETPQPSQATTATPQPDQLALLTNTPTPLPSVAPTAAESQQPSAAYRRQEQQTLIRGSISNRGISSVNALGTPLGQYKKKLLASIGSRWYYYMENRGENSGIGNASVTFFVDRSGRVRNLKVIENTSNATFESICLRSISEVQLPPIPEDVAASLPPEGLAQEITFTMFPNNQ
jgi:outer membrane biosynthesis protein TonB